MLLIPIGFRSYPGTVPRTIILKTNTGYFWMVKLRDVKDTAIWIKDGLDFPLPTR
jgi:hypothetical protein